MVKLNIDGFVEAECPMLNKYEMKKLNLSNSPGLKVQIFLDKYEAQKAFTGHRGRNSCTTIICPIIYDKGLCFQNKKSCIYGSLTIKDKQDSY